MKRWTGVATRMALLALPLAAVMAGAGEIVAASEASSAVIVAFRDPVSLDPGTPLELHIEVPTGQRFRFPFQRLSDAEQQQLLSASEAALMKARREDAGPATAAAAGSDHAPPASSKPSPAAPAPGPMAGSDHAGSGHADSPSAASPSPAPAPAASRTVTSTRQLGTHTVVVAVLPALFTLPVAGPAYRSRIALLGCSDGDHYATTPGTCPQHGRPLAAGPIASFEAAVVLGRSDAPVNLRIQAP